jgi:hypothetical protein
MAHRDGAGAACTRHCFGCCELIMEPRSEDARLELRDGSADGLTPVRHGGRVGAP